jgi:Fungal specific transcription factor domain
MTGKKGYSLLIQALCGQLLHQRGGLSSALNHEISILKCIVLYGHVISATTAFRELEYLEMLAPGISHISPLGSGNEEPFQGKVIPEIGFDLKDEERPLFSMLYGFSYSILELISETNKLANEIESFLAQNAGLAISSTLRSQARGLESRVLAKVTDPERLTPDSDANVGALGSAISVAMSNTLVINFFRRIRKTNPAILQQYVKVVFASLAGQETIKLRCELDSGIMMWPMFHAACEAVGLQLQNTALMFIQRARNCGLRVADNAEKVMREVWARREISDDDIDLRDVLRDLNVQITLF